MPSQDPADPGTRIFGLADPGSRILDPVYLGSRIFDHADLGSRDHGFWILQIPDPRIQKFGSCRSWIPISRILDPAEPLSRYPGIWILQILEAGFSIMQILDPVY